LRRHSFKLIGAILVGAIAAIISQTGCRETTLIDSKVAPNLNSIDVYAIPDTFTIISKTVYDDSVVTSFNVSGLPINHALGTIGGTGADPFFGKTNGGIFMQIIPESTNPTTTIFSTPDSVILFIPYSGYVYGDTANGSDQTVNVYPMQDTLGESSTYYPFTQKPYDPTRLYGSATIKMKHLNDSVFMYGLNRMPALRVVLNSKFITDIANASTTAATDYPTFLNAFKGLYIGPDTNQTGSTLPFFRLDGIDTFTQANVLWFYRDASGTEQVFQFPFSTTYCGHYNYITRNYTGTPASTYFSSAATTDSLILVQNQPGAALDIRIPFLKNLSSSIPKMVINRAELIITQVPTNTSSVFTAPTKLYAVGINPSDGSKYQIADRTPVTSTTPLTFLNGYLQYATIAGQSLAQYTINLPREVINTINQQRELHLHINGTQDYPGACRLIAGGSNYPDINYRIRLHIVYSSSKQQ